MRGTVLFLVAGSILLAGEAQARKPRDGYPYDRTSSGCVQGDCLNGYGVYVYPDDDIYEGSWKDGEQHGWGTYYLVDGDPWPDTHKITGNWINGKKHGKITYFFPNGATRLQYWFHGEDASSRVANCRDAQTLSSAYKGFVAIVNGACRGGAR